MLLVAPLGEQTDLAAAEAAPYWHRLFPGEPRQVGQVRNWLRSLVPDCRARDDVLSVASELAANAVQHTRSGSGGWFRVQLIVLDHQVIRVTVVDSGGPRTPEAIHEPQHENGRGLCVVQALSARCGYSGGEDGRQVWAEIPRPGTPAGQAR